MMPPNSLPELFGYGTTPIKDSGQRREFPTGSRRDIRSGKGRYDLLPWRAIHALAIHMEKGSAKYGDRNWEKGQPLSVYMDSALRHQGCRLRLLFDEPHMVAAAWNLLAFIETEIRIAEGSLPRELDDLPQPPIQRTDRPKPPTNGTT